MVCFAFMGLRLVAQLKGGLQGGGNLQDRPGSVGTRTPHNAPQRGLFKTGDPALQAFDGPVY